MKPCFFLSITQVCPLEVKFSLGFNQVKVLFSADLVGESGAFPISSDPQRKADRQAMARMKMKAEASQKFTEENKVFGIISHDCRLLSSHEYYTV